MEPTIPTTQPKSLRRYFIRGLVVVIILFFGILAYLSESPSTFPAGSLITVHSGDTITSISKELKAKHIIRSTILFRGAVELLTGKQKIVAGDYYFSQPVSVYNVASRLAKGNFDLAIVKLTIPEGYSMPQIASLLSARLLHFSVTDFMKYYPAKEGYLFPDTYYFVPDTTAADVISFMQNNFDEKIQTVEPTIVAFGKPENDVIIMASILEKEASIPQDMSIISGILWKRLKIGMPLQVDVATSTYAHKGLPPTPIANPGLRAITAAVTPTTTPYLYYLSDENGVIHYAATFAEHIKNRTKYQK